MTRCYSILFRNFDFEILCHLSFPKNSLKIHPSVRNPERLLMNLSRVYLSTIIILLWWNYWQADLLVRTFLRAWPYKLGPSRLFRTDLESLKNYSAYRILEYFWPFSVVYRYFRIPGSWNFAKTNPAESNFRIHVAARPEQLSGRWPAPNLTAPTHFLSFTALRNF